MATVYACVDLISRTIATLPFQVYLKTEHGTELREGHPLNRLISRRPNEKYNSIDFRRAFVSSMLLHGNAYILPVREGNQLKALELIPNDNVVIDTSTGKLRYKIYIDGRYSLELNADQIIHLKAFTLDGINGISPISYARETIGTGIAASQHLAKHYGKGTVPPGLLQIQETIRDPERLKIIGGQFDDAVKNGRTPVLPGGAEYKGITTTLRDSQFIETMKWGKEEVCSIYQVPPHKVGMLDGGAQNNSIEAQNNQFLMDCIRPWVEIIELEFEEKLLSNNSFIVEMDMNSLLRGDTLTQVQRQVSLWNIGAINADEIRREWNLPPIPGGQEFFSPMHMSTQNDIQNGKINKENSGAQKGAKETESATGSGAN